MSFRYASGINKPGFNPLIAPTPIYLNYLNVWGANGSGQLGLGDTANRSSPVQVGSDINWSTFSAFSSFVTSIKTDGTLWSWGSNSSGRLGLGNTTSYSSPKQVGALTNWLKVSAAYCCLAIKTDGTLWAWGQNTYGQLGDGTTVSKSSPVQIGALTNWLKIAANGYYTSIAIKTDGTLWSWGRNNSGQIGNNTTTDQSSPVQIGALTNWLSIAGGGYNGHSFAIKTDGTLWAWGKNITGQLGLGNTTNYSSPKQVGLLTSWLKISSGNYSGIAIKTNGTLWSWGFSNYGQLGLGNTTTYSSPKQVGSLTNWLYATAGGYNAAGAIKTDGTLWMWGNNSLGTLGFGNTTSYSSPKQLGSLASWVNLEIGWVSTFGY